ncbi:hypothetical protein Bca52824_023903 [Brassica carinata]|uniref:Uncharacterized protein n=1 Tax=Brassica carinata TaxID=52824 RepID=A0A8X7VJ96_BRACI|nr:hypothetical protein Bca52824_023903 [Brassica carinata]
MLHQTASLETAPSRVDLHEEDFPSRRSTPLSEPVIPAVASPLPPPTPPADSEDVPAQENDEIVQDMQAVENEEIQAAHPMTTRARAGIVKPNPRYAMFTVKDEYAEPKSVRAALKHQGKTGPSFQLQKQSVKSIKPTTSPALAVNKQCRHQRTEKTAHGLKTTAQDLFSFNRFHCLDADATVC